MFTSKNLKFILYGLAVVLAAGIYWYTSNLFSQIDQRNIRMEELFALTALLFLYLSVLANPLKRLFPNSDRISTFKELQPSLVIITLSFAVLHATIAFFFLLGGFAGLSFLPDKFLIGLPLGVLAALTLLLVIGYNKLSRRFLWMNNLLYIVGILITVHALLLGADFIVLSAAIPKIFFTALLVLLAVEAWSFDSWLNQQNAESKKFGPIFAVCLIILAVLGAYLLLPQSQLPSISEHAGHVMPDGTIMLPPGPDDKKYNVSLATTPLNPQPGQDVTLKFKIFDSASGTPVTDFNIIMTKILHLVIVDGSLTYFDHIHPTLNGSELTVTTKFPKDDLYRLYLNFEPAGATEQQIAVTLPVGTGISSAATLPVSERTRAFGEITASISAADGAVFSASKMNMASQGINFNFKNTVTGEPITDLMPYLGAFGHLVMINDKTYEYIHVHPATSVTSDYSGPDVQFVPAAMFGTIKPGTYRVFGQFNRANQIFVADFTINIE